MRAVLRLVGKEGQTNRAAVDVGNPCAALYGAIAMVQRKHAGVSDCYVSSEPGTDAGLADVPAISGKDLAVDSE